MDYWELATLDLLVEYANSMPPPDFSMLAELVMQAAEFGDEVAAEVLRKEGEELAYLVRLVMRRLQVPNGTIDWMPPIAFAGSIMEKFSPVRTALIKAIQQEFPNVRTIAGVVDPIVGAVWRARRR
jgi:N-acetylglucosamine kinase-like BadF-type ATPase